MRNLRLIARLDIKGTNLIKGVHLEGLRIIGSPAQYARRYYEQGADELIYMGSQQNVRKEPHVKKMSGAENIDDIVNDMNIDDLDLDDVSIASTESGNSKSGGISLDI